MFALTSSSLALLLCIARILERLKNTNPYQYVAQHVFGLNWVTVGTFCSGNDTQLRVCRSFSVLIDQGGMSEIGLAAVGTTQGDLKVTIGKAADRAVATQPQPGRGREQKPDPLQPP